MIEPQLLVRQSDACWRNSVRNVQLFRRANATFRSRAIFLTVRYLTSLQKSLISSFSSNSPVIFLIRVYLAQYILWLKRKFQWVSNIRLAEELYIFHLAIGRWWPHTIHAECMTKPVNSCIKIDHFGTVYLESMDSSGIPVYNRPPRTISHSVHQYTHALLQATGNSNISATYLHI